MRCFLASFNILALPETALPQDTLRTISTVVADVEMGNNVEFLRYSFLVTFASPQAISLPADFMSTDMPAGLHLIGPPRCKIRFWRWWHRPLKTVWVDCHHD